MLQINLSFTRQDKLIGAKAHQRVFESGKRKKSKYFQAIFSKKSTTSAQLGLIFPKKIQSKAVVRNRLKRINREWFRQHKEELEADLIILLLGAGKGVSIEELEQDCLKLWQIVRNAVINSKNS